VALGGALAGTARVVLHVDDDRFHRDFKRDQETFQRGTREMQRDTERLSRGVLAGSGAFRSLGRSIAFASGSFLGGVGFAAVVRSSISAASDLHEQLNKTDVVFRTSAREVKAWSQTTAGSLGIARGEALGFAATFGNLLVPMGFARKAAASMSVALVQLAGDLASFNNASPEDTLRALQAGLVGQVRPLRQFGIFLSDDRVKAEALADGIAKTNKSISEVTQANRGLAIAEAKLRDVQKQHYGPNTTQYQQALLEVERAQGRVTKAVQGHTVALTDQQKAQARYNIIFKDSKDAQGDFARTSGGLANQLRILRAETTDLEEKLGTALMPTVLRIIRGLTGWLGNTRNVESLQRNLNTTLSITGGVLRGLFGAIGNITRLLGGWRNTLIILGGLWVGLKLKAVASNVAIAVSTRIEAARTAAAWTAAQRVAALRFAATARSAAAANAAIAVSSQVAARTTATVWRAALASTGWGLLAIAAGEAATYVILHWQKVRRWFRVFWIELQRQALLTFQSMVEPFSHLPGRLGAWARRAKESVLAQLADLGVQSLALSTKAGDAAGQAFGMAYDRGVNKWVQKGPPGALGPTDAQGPTSAGPRLAGGRGARGAAAIAVSAAAQPGAGSTGFHLPGERRPYDCSAFVQAVYARAGIHIGGNTYAQVKQGHHVDRSQLQPGDLIFMNFPGERSPGHVGIYIGGGRMVHDHGAHGGVEEEGVPWGNVVDTRTYVSHGGPSIPTGPIDDSALAGGPSPGDLTVGGTSPRDRAKARREKREREYRERVERAETEPVRGRTPGAAFTAPFRAIQGVFEARQAGTRLVTRRGTPFGAIQVRVPAEQAQTVADWQQLEHQIAAAAKKIKARLAREVRTLAKLRRALKKAEKRKRPDPHVIKRLRQEIADCAARVAVLRDELTGLRGDYIACEEAIAALKDEKADPTDLPEDLQLQIAQAELTEDTGDDLAALQAEERYLEQQLNRADLTTAQRVSLTQSLAGVLGDIRNLSGQTAGTNPDLEAQLQQALALAANAQRSSSLANAFVGALDLFPGQTGPVPGAPAAQGFLAQAQGGQGGTLVVQSLFPPPTDWLRDAAGAVAQGAGLQGYVPASQTNLGL